VTINYFGGQINFAGTPNATGDVKVFTGQIVGQAIMQDVEGVEDDKVLLSNFFDPAKGQPATQTVFSDGKNANTCAFSRTINYYQSNCTFAEVNNYDDAIAGMNKNLLQYFASEEGDRQNVRRTWHPSNGIFAPVGAPVLDSSDDWNLATPVVDLTGAKLYPGDTVSIHVPLKYLHNVTKHTGTNDDPEWIVQEKTDVVMHSSPVVLTSAQTSANAYIDVTITIPFDVEPGIHHLEFRGTESGAYQAAGEFEVLMFESDEGLAATGVGTDQLLLFFILLLLAASFLSTRRTTRTE
jgi:hypothetical protein